jgi:hypothetical protein
MHLISDIPDCQQVIASHHISSGAWRAISRHTYRSDVAPNCFCYLSLVWASHAETRTLVERSTHSSSLKCCMMRHELEITYLRAS